MVFCCEGHGRHQLDTRSDAGSLHMSMISVQCARAWLLEMQLQAQSCSDLSEASKLAVRRSDLAMLAG